MALCIALHGIYQFIIAAPIPASWVSQTEQNVRTRVYSLTGSPNIMGSLLVLFAPMVAGLAYYSRKMWVKVLAVCGTGMMCMCCIFTFSKGAWGGLVVAVLVFAIFLDRRRRSARHPLHRQPHHLYVHLGLRRCEPARRPHGALGDQSGSAA